MSNIADESLIVNRTITYASNSKKSWFKNSYRLYFKNSTINAIAFKFKQYKSLHVHVRIYCQAPKLYYNFVHTQCKFCSSIKFCLLWIYPAKYIIIPWVLLCALDTGPSVVYSKPSAAHCNSHKTWSCPRFSSCRLNRTKSGLQTVNISQ